MSTLTIRNLDPELVTRFKAVSAARGRSMEAQLREMIRAEVLSAEEPDHAWVDRIRARFAGYEFEIPERSKEMPREIDFGA